jgi:lysozyme family protein
MTSRELFNLAIEVVLEHEGESYVDNPSDAGGPTKFGIAQRWNPDLNIRGLTRGQAIEIYWQRYWAGRGYDKLPAGVAIKSFDLAVNMGKKGALTCLQRALRAAGIRVAVDGILGPETWNAASDVDPGVLIAALRSEAACEYRLLIARNPSQEVFRDGWLNRAYA